MMKRFLVILLAVLLAFSGAAGYFAMKERPAAAPDAEEISVSEEPAEQSFGITLRTIDRAAVYALHDPDEIVASINGRDVSWDEYFYWLSGCAASVENYMLQMAMYQTDVNWTDPLSDETEETYLDSVYEDAEQRLKIFAAIEAVAAENGVELNAEEQEQLQKQLEQYRTDALGEEATDADFLGYLQETEHMRYETLQTFIRDSLLYQACFNAIYGKDGAAVSDEDALAWLEESGYMRANHILRLTTDMTTGEALDENAAEQKGAEAASIAARLQAIEDPEELLAELAQLKEQWDEDSGREANPDGYVFGEGEMVEPFEAAVKALHDYQVSDPVKTEYGYHVIVRLPLEADLVLGYTSAGTPMTARAACANARYGELLDARLASMQLQLAEGFEQPDLAQFIVEESY